MNTPRHPSEILPAAIALFDSLITDRTAPGNMELTILDEARLGTWRGDWFKVHPGFTLATVLQEIHCILAFKTGKHKYRQATQELCRLLELTPTEWRRYNNGRRFGIWSRDTNFPNPELMASAPY